MLAGKVYSGRLVRPALFGGSPEWTAGVRRHPTAVVAAAVVLLVCACIPYAGFPALYLAAAGRSRDVTNITNSNGQSAKRVPRRDSRKNSIFVQNRNP